MVLFCYSFRLCFSFQQFKIFFLIVYWYKLYNCLYPSDNYFVCLFFCTIVEIFFLSFLMRKLMMANANWLCRFSQQCFGMPNSILCPFRDRPNGKSDRISYYHSHFSLPNYSRLEVDGGDKVFCKFGPWINSLLLIT
jgi:hypothetical protein